MSKENKFESLLLALLGVLPAFANGAVSLREAYTTALSKNEIVAVRQSETVQAQERVTQGWARVMPNVNLVGNYLRQDQATTAGTTSAFTRPDQHSLKVSLVQPIFHGFGDWHELSARKALVRSQELTQKQTRLQMAGLVAEAYYLVLQAESDKRDLEEQLSLTEKRIEDLKSRVRIGRSRKGEMLSAEAQRASVIAQREQAVLNIQTSRRNFSGVTRLPEDSVLVDLASANTAAKEDQPLPSLSDALNATERRPDILAAKERQVASEKSVDVFASQHYPSLDLAANYYINRTGILENSKWDVGAVLTIPLFQGGQIVSQVREANEKKRSQELAVSQLREDVRKEITTWHATYHQNAAQLLAFDEATRLSELNYNEQVRDFKNGLVNHLDVLTSLNSLEEVKRSRDRLKYQTEIARHKFLAAIGQEVAIQP